MPLLPLRPSPRGALVGRIATIQRELGSLATVVLEDVERVLARGIDTSSRTALDGVGVPMRDDVMAVFDEVVAHGSTEQA